MEDRADRVRKLAVGIGLRISEAEAAVLAEPLCRLIETIDLACADFAVEAPMPLARPGFTRWP
ncbi:MAG: hypothetical protein IVW54_18795 [Candidatus Binataceae bacterium]|nr:hypothetical protein [Candidatus Binataceae bacterium]